MNASVGWSVPRVREGFVSAEIGYRFRGGPIANEIPYAVKAGVFPISRVGVFVFARGWKSEADFTKVADVAGYFVSDSEGHAAGTELYVRLSRFFDLNGAWARTYAGKNVLAGDTFTLGVAFRKKVF